MIGDRNDNTVVDLRNFGDAAGATHPLKHLKSSRENTLRGKSVRPPPVGFRLP